MEAVWRNETRLWQQWVADSFSVMCTESTPILLLYVPAPTATSLKAKNYTLS